MVRFAFQVQSNHPRFSYENHITDIYRGFHHHNIPVDVISEKDSLAGYKLVIVPAMYVITERTAAHLEKFAADGGTVALTVRTGVKDEFNTVVNQKLPGLVSNLCGVEVEVYISMVLNRVTKSNLTCPNSALHFPPTH